MHLLALFGIFVSLRLSARNSRMLDQTANRAVKGTDDGNIDRVSERLLFG